MSTNARYCHSKSRQTEQRRYRAFFIAPKFENVNNDKAKRNRQENDVSGLPVGVMGGLLRTPCESFDAE
jgi:hypothetical protein